MLAEFTMTPSQERGGRLPLRRRVRRPSRGVDDGRCVAGAAGLHSQSTRPDSTGNLTVGTQGTGQG